VAPASPFVLSHGRLHELTHSRTPCNIRHSHVPEKANILIPLLLRKLDFPAMAIFYRQHASSQLDETKINLFCFNVCPASALLRSRDSSNPFAFCFHSLLHT
jgi:hypothetical protein